MKKQNFSIKVIFFLSLLIQSLIISGQEYSLSALLSASNGINIYNIKKVSDGIIVYGDYKGTLNANGTHIADDRDVYLVKYNNDFQIQWAKQIGGTLIDLASDLKVSEDGSIYLLSSFTGTCLFNGTNQISSTGSYDVILAKYNNSGDFIWGKNIAYNLADQYGTCMTIDKFGDLIIGGYYKDSISFSDTSFVSSYGMYYAKLDNGGNFLWAKNIPSTSSSSQLRSLSAFNDGYYINGIFKETSSFDLGNEISNTVSYTDVFLYKTDFSGDGLWLRRTYGDKNAFTGTITNDEYDNVYYTGYFGGLQMEIDLNETQKSNTILYNNGVTQDIFILKYNKEGSLIWAMDYGMSGDDFDRDIKYQNNFLYITGYFTDSLIFGSDTLFSGSTTDMDAFLGMIDRGGNTLKAIKVTDSNDGSESGMKLSSDSYNNAFWGGYFNSTSITIGDSTFINPYSGKRSVFVSKYKPPYVAAFTKKTNVSCNQGSDGELIVTPYFGVLPYTYSWSHDAGLNDSTATGLTAGTYTVTVTDFLDSVAVVQYTLTEPDSFIFDPAITQVTTCSYSAEGAINLNVTGGNGENTYYWFEADGGSGVQLTMEDQFNLTTGSYSVTVTDSKGCTSDTTIYITGPESITFSNTIVTNYSGPMAKGKIDLVYEGGFGDPASYAFSWQGPSGYTSSEDSISNLDPGNYTVTASDVHSCDFDTTFNVKDLDTFYVYISDYKHACNGTINGHATASYYSPEGHTNITYQWDANADNQITAKATNLAPGRYYYVTVTDLDNTPNSVMVDSIYIDELSYTFSGSISGISTTTLGCYGDTDGFIDLNITDAGTLPYLYLWNTGATTQDLINLPVGTYSVTATDANECQFSVTNYQISQPTVLAATAEIVSKPSCYGDYDGEITVLRNGGTGPYTYQWNDPGFQTEQNATGLDVGYYTVTVTDYNGCTKNASVNLTQPDALSVIKTVYPVSCNSGNDGTALLIVTGGTVSGSYTYDWSTTNGSGLVLGNEDQITLTTGNYDFTITDDNACTYLDSVEITEPDILEITNESKTDVSTCFGDTNGTITITASGGTGTLTYTLNPGAIQVNNTGVFTGLTAGTYTVDVDDINGCGPVTSNSITIEEPIQISIEETLTTNASCFSLSDGSVDITVSGGTIASDYNYNWSTANGSGLVNGNADQSGLSAGTYNLTVTDNNSCSETTSIIINQPDEIVIDSTKIIDASSEMANDGSITIYVKGGAGTYNFTLNPGAVQTNQTGIFTGLLPGEYTIEVVDTDGCGPVTSDALTVSYTVGLDNVNFTDNIKVYPNPTSSKITVEINNIQTDGYTISIFDVTGMQVYSEKIKKEGLIKKEIDLSGYAKGIYSIQIIMQDRIMSQKIILQ
ncbi:MAG: hypothetical protein A2X13_09815 [Bacteroidetes bacterium GWC2_33_15]|nr:MAG: hypothetical protein A2X10_10560 [Bacteroidetes bacterium GWA2_33_15]OFX48996.1 MAG: hypothetical protein A2X13_09815 [Bacteroidetes bacterium GWC2_33_15]OFX64740.1 MAG: hypothetical protein A2X15_05400 [Bacteroidetes bacterium GWB2_32_14]OFX68442.1 MAG: hypothetical protein A2X14_14955 [Bacteroidetes bacterium GWD2_33_33]HAN19165.1 hypothetical protein [Bacteroidales bacterium]